MESSFKIKTPQKLDLNSYLNTLKTANDDYQILNQHLNQQNQFSNILKNTITANDEILINEKQLKINKTCIPTTNLTYTTQYISTPKQNFPNSSLEQKLNFPNYRINIPNNPKNYYL